MNMTEGQIKKRRKYGKHAGECEECGLMLMDEAKDTALESDNLPIEDGWTRHTDVYCPRCKKKVKVA